MKYIPQSELDRTELLKEIGAKNVDELFSCIPQELRAKTDLGYPLAESEQELRIRFDEIAKLSQLPDVSFAGCGTYHHDIPSIVPFIQGRSEYATAYTPYQPEISQGLLQAIYEFQTLACQLTETELSNSSLYDGATSLGEALLMALRIKKKSGGKILITESLHPFYFDVLKSYAEHFQDRFEILECQNDYSVDPELISKKLAAGNVDALITQSPNLFGTVEDYPAIGALIKKSDALWITSTMEPLSWGLLKGPGAFGAHIVTGEGQSFGNLPYLAGAPYGFFCTKNEFLRNLPGRLVGETVDEDSKRSYVLTFATREQFIRRGRATSNICTNNNLNMLAGLFHLCALGKSGIRELAEHNFSKTEFVKSELRKNQNLEISSSPSFNEFTVTTPKEASFYIQESTRENWVCGVDLGRFNQKWKHKLLVHVSELHTKKNLQKLIELLNR